MSCMLSDFNFKTLKFIFNVYSQSYLLDNLLNFKILTLNKKSKIFISSVT